MSRTNQEALEKVYLQELDNDIVNYLAAYKDTSLENALDIYYRSQLCAAIHQGLHGIQYLDHRVLVEEYFG
ncbi:MAG: hypothetical protein IKA80_00305 [Spirochaetaceae bacterium]|nr:hypothetical protein [Spirochaetaceae bacterium]MBQ8384908.1 hypothetical protein [Spirochaetaceae bacterium]MBR2361074.1 hypothetical protein [Spirochaetaceae bacterium]